MMMMMMMVVTKSVIIESIDIIEGGVKCIH